jgi:hypothetical protein
MELQKKVRLETVNGSTFKKRKVCITSDKHPGHPLTSRNNETA